MRKEFPCGHVGKGKHCHRCAGEARAAQAAADALAAVRREGEAVAELARAEKRAWEALFDADPVDLRRLPTNVVLKAREVLARLAAGAPYMGLGGKRWESDRHVVTIPVGRRFRLVMRDEAGQLRPLQVVSHEAYNNLSPDQLRAPRAG